MTGNTIAQTLEMLKGASLGKATFQQSTGLVEYNLEAPAKRLYPVLTPLRNSIPRVGGGTGTAVHWKAITGVNSSGLSVGVAEGQRNAFQAVSEADYVASYATLGMDINTSMQAQWAGGARFDNRAEAQLSVLRSLMIGEESVIKSGNASLALGTAPTPTVTASASGGSLASQTLSVRVVALTPDGYANASVAAGVPLQVARTNADGSTVSYGGGSSKASANATASVTGPDGSAAVFAPAVPGACAYAWYWGAAGSEVLGAISTTNAYTITATASGTQNASAASADNSTNGLVFDGLLTQAFKAGSNAYVQSLDGGTLTSDGASGVEQIENALLDRWNNYHLSPDIIYVSAQEAVNINKKVVAGGGTPLFRFNLDATDADVAKLSVTAGALIGNYLAKFANGGAGGIIPIRVHPYMTPGTMLMMTRELPYPLSNVSHVAEIETRKEYYSIAWPLKTLAWEDGVYVDEVLKHYFPPSMAVIYNIANG